MNASNFMVVNSHELIVSLPRAMEPLRSHQKRSPKPLTQVEQPSQTQSHFLARFNAERQMFAE